MKVEHVVSFTVLVGNVTLNIKYKMYNDISNGASLFKTQGNNFIQT